MTTKERLIVAASAIGAVIEIFAILLIGALFMRWATGLMGLEGYREVAATWQPGDPVPWGQLAINETIRHIFRYGLIFGGAFAWGYAWFRFGLRDYGFTLAEKPLTKHLTWGVGLFLLIGLPTKLIIEAMKNADLGDGPAHWAMLEEGSGLGFWAFMAVSSFLLPPIFEEIYFRGYAQTRLTRVVGPIPAILTIAALFTAVHTQYHALELTSMVMIVLLFIGAAASGFTRHITGSLLAPLLAHALVNIPISL